METYADEWAVSCCLLTVSNMSKAIKLIVRFIQTIKHSYDIFEKKDNHIQSTLQESIAFCLILMYLPKKSRLKTLPVNGMARTLKK